MSTPRTVRALRKAKQAGIPADCVFDVTRALMRDQRKPAKASTPARQATNTKGK